MTRAFTFAWLVLLPASACTCNDPAPMAAQAKYEAYEASPFFEDGRAMRPLPDHAMAREMPLPEAPVTDGGWAAEVPIPVDRALLEKGRHGFDIYCATCHGLLADGDSPVARKMALRKPPSLLVHQPHSLEDGGTAESFGHLLPGHVYEVITHGFGLMPSYAAELDQDERWAVAAYLDALRLSQTARVAELPPEYRARVEERTP